MVKGHVGNYARTAAVATVPGMARILYNRAAGAWKQNARGSGAKRAINHARRAAGSRIIKKTAPKQVSSKGRGSRGGFVSAVIGSNLKTRVVKRTRGRRIGLKGLMFEKKTGGTTDTQEELFLGHSTCPLRIVVNHMWRTLVKQIITRAQGDVVDTDTALDDVLSVGDRLFVFFQYSEGQPLTAEVLFLTPADTVNSIALWFGAPARPWSGTDAQVNQMIFYAIKYQPAPGATLIATPVFLHMKMARVSWDASSLLKFQNRTVDVAAAGETENQITDVDSIPLYAQIYEGKGTGATYIDRPPIAGAVPVFCANGDTGLIGAAPGVSYNAPTFLPDPAQFEKVSKSGSTDMLPGQIRSSFLKFKGSMLFSDFFLATHPNGAAVTNKFRSKLGSFRFFGVQKKIHFATSDTNMKSVYELDYKLSMNMSFGRKNVSTTVYQELFDQNITSA